MRHANVAQPLLQARELCVGYAHETLVANVSVRVECGQVVTLIGPNGAGKSTMLRTMAAQLEPLGGAVLLEGRRMDELSADARARKISVLLTDRVQTELLRCSEVVELGRLPHTGRFGLLTESDRQQVREAMELVGVWDLRDRDFMQLSDGQRQRVMLARALCQQPRLLLLDEPTSYLDIHHQIELLALLRRLVEPGELGIVMALHELPLAYRVSDWVVCIKDGALMTQGRPREVFVPEVIDALYDLAPGTYDATTGVMSLSQAPVTTGSGEGAAHA